MKGSVETLRRLATALPGRCQKCRRAVKWLDGKWRDADGLPHHCDML